MLAMFYKIVQGGYILSVGEAQNVRDNAITETEYNEILDVIHNKPPRTDTTDYRLREDLTWEEYEVEPPETDPDEEVTADEIAAAIQEALA